MNLDRQETIGQNIQFFLEKSTACVNQKYVRANNSYQTSFFIENSFTENDLAEFLKKRRGDQEEPKEWKSTNSEGAKNNITKLFTW